MKKTLLLFAAVIIAVSLNAQSQRTCATMEVLAAAKLADPGLEARMQNIERETQQWIANHPESRTSAVITIPVVFHVVYNTAAQNISDARLQSQLNVLNRDYGRTNTDAGSTPSVFQGVAANTNIQFCLAQRDPNGNATSGIRRVSTSTTSFSSNNNVKFTSSGGDDAWDRNSYLNIWVCNLGSQLLGYAQFPGGSASTDGVVVLYSSVGGAEAPGTIAGYTLGRSATHEVGHWLNLIHIWGDASCGNDQVADTPTQSTSNFGCPSFPHVTCSNGPNGDMFMNYMDYSDDACMNMFSAGQSARMNATLNGTRVSLQSSQGCVAPGGCSIPTGLSATSITTTTATLNWGAVSGAVSYNVHYRVNGTSTWTNTTAATNSKAISGLTAGTQYEFQSQTVCSAATSAYSASGTFTTSNPACTDTYEPNNTGTVAKLISVATNVVGLISPSGDLDFFKFKNTAAKPNIKVTLTNLPADYDLRLIKGSTTVNSTNGGLTSETIIYNTSTVGTYKIRVNGNGTANNATSCYTLNVQISASPFRKANDTETEITEKVSSFSLFPNPANELINVRLNSADGGNATFNITDLTGRIVMTVAKNVDAGSTDVELNINKLNSGVYFINVTNGSYTEVQKFIVSK